MSFAAAAGGVCLTAAVFLAGLLIAPEIPKLSLQSSGPQAPEEHIARSSAFGAPSLRGKPLPPTAANALRIAAFANTGVAYEALQHHTEHLDAILPEWILATPSGDIRRVRNSLEPAVTAWLRSRSARIRVLPQLRAWPESTSGDLAMRIADKGWSARLRNSAVSYLQDAGHDGLAISFPELPRLAQPHFIRFLQALSLDVHNAGKLLLVVIPPETEIGPAREASQYADYLVVGTHMERYSLFSEPIVRQAWLETRVAELSRYIEPSKLIFAIGSYAVQWSTGSHRRTISVQDAWSLAARHKAPIAFDTSALSSWLGFKDATGIEHSVWLLDAGSAFNHLRAALSARPAGVALWQLGYEDPGVWEFLGRGRLPDQAALTRLRIAKPGFTSAFEPQDVLVQSMPVAQDGRRSLSFSQSAGLILTHSMQRIPLRNELHSWDAVRKNTVALTFDDGPDPRFTPLILDLLAAKRVKATFYVVGRQAAARPDLLQRIYDEGHDIGHHSYSHRSMFQMSETEIALELNSTQRIFETQLGVQALLLRPPYLQSDALMSNTDSVGGWRVLEICSRHGYVFGAIQIDPQDWIPLQTAQRIAASTVQGVLSNEGGVVLLHDSGGDRSRTIEALSSIIDTLRQQGYTFTTTHEMVGKTREELMPRLDESAALTRLINDVRGAAILAPSWIGQNLPTFAMAATAIGIMRLLLIMAGAWRQSFAERRRNEAASACADRPTASVLVPGYNEEKVICRTIASLLASKGAPFDIIVIDDGSKDRTAEIVRTTFAGNDRVRVLTKPNGGKSSALNFGLQQTTSEVVVAIDADTVLAADAVDLLVRHFNDPSIGAVAGSAVVGNPVSLMARFQALEYVTCQHLDRRAFELVKAIGVVPGAIGAWRRESVMAAGGYSTETLAEDADLTIALQRAGWRIISEPRAHAFTEAPETVRAFLKQRHRWMFGTLQVAWKHSDLWRSGRAPAIAWLLLPNIFLFQFGFTLIAPLMDLLLAAGIATAAWEFVWSAGTSQPIADLGLLARYWVLFQIFDFATAAFSIHLSGEAKHLRLIPLLVLQRFSYRQILYLVALRSLAAAVKGQFVGWGKLARTGRVSVAAVPESVSAPAFRSKQTIR